MDLVIIDISRRLSALEVRSILGEENESQERPWVLNGDNLSAQLTLSLHSNKENTYFFESSLV